jgi:hypothetical protein
MTSRVTFILFDALKNHFSQLSQREIIYMRYYSGGKLIFFHLLGFQVSLQIECYTFYFRSSTQYINYVSYRTPEKHKRKELALKAIAISLT